MMTIGKGWKYVAAAVLCVLLPACGTRVKRVDPGTEDRDTVTGSKDIIAVAQYMASQITQLPQIANAKNPPRIAFAEVTNKTHEVIDKEMFIRKMRTLLIKHAGGKMIFLDRAKSVQIIQEREMKRKGEISSSGHRVLLGADYFLTGVISSIDKASDGRRSTYTSYAFRLVDAESSAIIWEDEMDAKKIAKSGLFDR